MKAEGKVGEREVCLNHNHIYPEDSFFFLVRNFLQKPVLVTEQRGHSFQKVQYDLET